MCLGESCITGDYDGDLRSDLACHQGNGKWQLALAKPGKWQTFLEISGPVAPEIASDRCIAADLNHDTLSDIICAQTASGTWHVGIATAGPAFDSSLWTSGPVLDGKLSERCLAGDIDGDGRSDVSCVSSSGSEWITGLSTGKSWSAAKWNSPAPFPLPLHRHCVMGDLQGTGQAGLACKIGGTSWLAGRSAKEFGDLLSHITGLYGGETVVKFASSAASFDPRLPALHVVESMENRDGMGGQVSSRFEYRHGRYNPVAADFRGFGEVVVTRAGEPAVDGIKITHRFLQGDQSTWGPDSADDPIGIYRGRTAQRETAEASGKMLARSEFGYHGDPSPPYFTPTSEVREFTCHGTCLPPNRSTLTYDSFGNRTEEKVFMGGTRYACNGVHHSLSA